MYHDLRKQRGKGPDMGEDYPYAKVEVFKLLEDDKGKYDDNIFVVRKTVIHDEWKKVRARKHMKKKE